MTEYSQPNDGGHLVVEVGVTVHILNQITRIRTDHCGKLIESLMEIN